MESMYDPIPTDGDEVPTKKVRHRKKQFLQSIRKQMEFYFSDANLSKNRFLGQLVSKDPEVDLSIFLQFNKIREITNDLKDIRKALKKSEMLALTEDGAKVFRKTSVGRNDRTDESTIYVEQLPPDADHEWLRSVFLPYGDVAYVSIPKYPHNGLNKGFAFIEFDSPESATKALEAFGAMGCRLTSEIPPEQICSNKSNASHHRNEIPIVLDPNFKVPAEKNVKKKAKNKTKKLKSDSVEDVPLEDIDRKSMQPERKRTISFDDEREVRENCMPVQEDRRVKKTKVKLETEAADETELSVKGAERSGKDDGNIKLEPNIKVEAESESENVVKGGDEHDLNTTNLENKTPKKRKHKKSHEELEESCEHRAEEGSGKHSKKRRKEADDEGGADESTTETEDSAAPKDDEKENEGSEEGRKRKRSRNHKKKNKKERVEAEPTMNLRVLSKFEWKRLRNKYLDLQKVKMTQLKQLLHRSRWGSSASHDHPEGGRRQPESGVAERKPKTEKKFEFTPGVIVRLKLHETIADTKKFKNDARANPEVKYVDVKEDCDEAYIRCSTAEAAGQLVAQKLWPQMDVLTGVEETSYWEKMNRDRELKCGRNERVKVRGKTKLLARVEKAVGKHIRFTTDEEITPKG